MKYELPKMKRDARQKCSQNFGVFDNFYSRLKNFLRGWLLILGLKEGLLECATVCVKSEVILSLMHHIQSRFREA